MDPSHHDEGAVTPPRTVPDEAPDAVETRDPWSRPTPRRNRVWLYAIVPAVFIAIWAVWMFRVERQREGSPAGAHAVTGTSGARDNDPEGLGRGDEKPLNPPGTSPRIIADMELLTKKDDYIGHAVEIPAVAVIETPGPRTMWIGRPLNRTLVLLDRGAPPPGNLKSGDQVGLSGRLEKRPDKAAIDRAGLHENDRKALEGVDVFIRASAMRPLARDESGGLLNGGAGR
jgi:hypothetical protein